jgi:hypothetical protein
LNDSAFKFGGNALKRGTKDAEKGDQLDIASQIVGAKARIQLTDLCRQQVILEAWQDKEKIHILSCDKGQSRCHHPDHQ